MVTSNYAVNKGEAFYANQSLKPLNLNPGDQKKIEHLQSCCSKWAENISKWSLAAKVATFILTLPFAPVLLTVYAATRFADNQTKKMIEDIKQSNTSTRTPNLIKNLYEDKALNLVGLVAFARKQFNEPLQKSTDFTKDFNELATSIAQTEAVRKGSFNDAQITPYAKIKEDFNSLPSDDQKAVINIVKEKSELSPIDYETFTYSEVLSKNDKLAISILGEMRNPKKRLDQAENFYKLALDYYEGDKVKALQFLDAYKRKPEILHQVAKDAQRGLISVAGKPSFHEQALNAYRSSISEQKNSPNIIILAETHFKGKYSKLDNNNQFQFESLIFTYMTNPNAYAKAKTQTTHSDVEAFALDLIDEITKPYLKQIINTTFYNDVVKKFDGDQVKALRFLDLCQQDTVINIDKAPFTHAAATINDAGKQFKGLSYGAKKQTDKNAYLTIDLENKTITTKSYLSVSKSGVDENDRKIDDTLLNIEVDGTFAFDKSVTQKFSVTSIPKSDRDLTTQKAVANIQSIFEKTLGKPKTTSAMDQDVIRMDSIGPIANDDDRVSNGSDSAVNASSYKRSSFDSSSSISRI